MKAGRAASVALSLAAAVAAAGAASGQDGLPAAWRLVGEGRYAEALSAATAEVDALARHQARHHVLHHAGDLEGALREALAGLELAPEDPWLLDQAAYVAISLRDASVALELCARLTRIADSPELAPEELARRRARAAALGEEAAELARQDEARRRALARARLMVAAALALSALAFARLAQEGSGRRKGAAEMQPAA